MTNKERRRLVLVAAGNQREFEHHMRELADAARAVEIGRPNMAWTIDGVEYRYVSNVDMMRGHRRAEVQLIGNWFIRPDADEILVQKAIMERAQ